MLSRELTKITANINNNFIFFIAEFVKDIKEARELADKIVLKITKENLNKSGCKRAFCSYEDFKKAAQ